MLHDAETDPPAPSVATSRRSRRWPRSRRSGLPGRFRCWWERLRGWPRELTPEPALRERLRTELAPVQVRQELEERLTRARLVRHSAVPLWIIVMAMLPQTHHLAVLAVDDVLVATALWLPCFLAAEWLALTRLLGSVTAPGLRAGLRRLGVDCCVRCGHVMASDRDAARCSECGSRHDHLPLHWGQAAAAPGALT